MLRLMRRRNALARDLELFEYIAEKGFSLGTDFITGHPGESEAIWREALENFRRFPITHLHGFTYSRRDGTHAATLSGGVPGDIAKNRLKELEAIVKENNYRFRQMHRTDLLVLIEEHKGTYQSGYDQYYNRVLVKSDLSLLKEWVHIKEAKVTMDETIADF